MKIEVVAHAMFPTLVIEGKNHDHQQIKDAVEQNFRGWLNPAGYGREHDGVNTIHHEKAFAPIYTLATAIARHYVSLLSIDPDRFDYYVTKSWFNILNEDHTPVHTHSDSHLAFVYYVNVPSGKETPIIFHKWEGRHEPYPRMCDINSPAEWNQFNSYGWSVTPAEGTLLLFPANLPHGVKARVEGAEHKSMEDVDTYRNSRVAIAGDILLVFKNKEARDMGLQPIHQWRLFGETQ